MQLIRRIDVKGFRSISDGAVDSLGDLTALAGLNNSGKSNLLRALNAFFTGRTEGASLLDFESDYHRPFLKRKKAKRIRIGLDFSLPESFNFRKGTEAAKKLLGREFNLAKEWTRDDVGVSYYLNGALLDDFNDRAAVDQFLSLVSFRYIPNRVLPLDVIRQEHHSLRDVLVRRLTTKSKDQSKAFSVLQGTSASLIRDLSERVKEACPGAGTVRLATPTSWKEMVFAFGYQLSPGDYSVADIAQGSGLQSLLMLETLSLIDRDRFKKFGWTQAAVWALEEPESSMHSSLEARVASYLSEIAVDPASRLQILTTTHSDYILQYADRAVLVTQDGGTTQFMNGAEKEEVLLRASRTGVTRWTHPILASPLNPVVIVEGKYDERFLREALRLVAPNAGIRISYLERLFPADDKGSITGGVTEIENYLKQNLQAIRTRVRTAPVIVLLDWDTAGRKSSFEKLLLPSDPCFILVWDELSLNPELAKSFRGVERAMSTRIINEADVDQRVAKRKDGTLTIEASDFGKLKERAYDVVGRGIQHDDIVHALPILNKLLEICAQNAKR